MNILRNQKIIIGLDSFSDQYMGHYQKMEQSRKAKRKKLVVHFFFFNGIVLLTGAYRI